MFLLNSRRGLFVETGKGFNTPPAPLLPKLRDHFAEFLNEGSLARLRILSSPTCVGLRYGRHNISLEVFLGSLVSMTSAELPASYSSLGINKDTDLPISSSYTLKQELPFSCSPNLLRHPIV